MQNNAAVSELRDEAFLARCKCVTQEEANYALCILSLVGGATPRDSFSDISYQLMRDSGFSHEDSVVMSVNGRDVIPRI